MLIDTPREEWDMVMSRSDSLVMSRKVGDRPRAVLVAAPPGWCWPLLRHLYPTRNKLLLQIGDQITDTQNEDG